MVDNLEKSSENYPEFLYHLHNWISLIDTPMCSIKDLIFIYSTVFNFKPNCVLEIGRFEGASTLTICGALSNAGVGHLWSIDIQDRVNKTVKDKIKNYSTLEIEDSKKLWNRPDLQRSYDICFIDGDHSFDSKINDLNFCAQYSSNNQIILLHDSNFPDVQRATEYFLKDNNQYVDCGVWGEKIRVIRK